MDYLDALLLSIVEGLTEFLPVSSTGHLVLAADILKVTQTEFVKSFEIIIQLGAISAIILLYGKTLVFNRKVLLKISTAFLPTAIVGFTLYKAIKDILIGNTTITLLALFLGGIALIGLELLHKEKDHHIGNIGNLSFKQCLIIGFCQSVSIIPGVSRAAATIIGGLFVGAKRKTAVEFSFLLAIPTMLAASGLDLLKSGLAFGKDEIILLSIGFIGSFVVAIAAVKFLLQYIKAHNFILFGLYRIVLALIFFIFSP